MQPVRKSKTSICGASADRIEVRGRDLVEEIIGKFSFTEAFLFVLLGQKPTAAQVRVVDAVLTAIMEHGLVPSVIASRLTILGAPESYQGAIASGLLGVGDRFAGTASETAKVLDRIVAAPPAERAGIAIAEVKSHRSRRVPLPGFGHPTHRTEDPRVAKLLQVVSETGGKQDYVAALKLLESALVQVLGRRLPTNVSAAIAVALREAELPIEAIRGVIMVARCAGLVGHLLEESREPIAEDIWHTVEQQIPYVSPSQG